MKQITFKDAQPEHGELLSDIAIESKGYWGYSRHQLDIWRKDLRIESSYIVANTVKLVVVEDNIVGFFALLQGETNYLDHLWLLPDYAGQGLGREVFNEILHRCQVLDIARFTIVSDPDAAGFYLHLGAKRIGEVFSKPQNRQLPLLEYVLP